MARTKRKTNPLVQEAESSAPAKKIYKTAAYVRLSVEDSGKPGADTIEGQKALLTSFIENKSDMELVALFCDNGRTGTDFDRPQFEKMMKEVRKGRVNCIVVKDLSRFGRNYKETGNYLERIFPSLGVRFIAINDNFDNRKLNYDINTAQDITQEVFYELFSHWDSFHTRTEAGLLTWLYRTADILIKKYFRLQKKAKKIESLQNANQIDFQFQVDSNLLAEEERRQYEFYIKEIKEKLSKKELQIFEYIILQKYTVSQTAKLLDMKENTVMVSLYRLRKKLNKLLDKIISINNSNEGGNK